MKKLFLAAIIMLCVTFAYTVEAVKVQPLFQDTSRRERVVSHNPAVQLGAPTRESSVYHTKWRYGRNRVRWHDQQRKAQWRRAKQRTYKAQA